MKKFTEEEMKHIADAIATKCYLSDLPAYPGSAAKNYVVAYDNAMQELIKINQDRE